MNIIIDKEKINNIKFDDYFSSLSVSKEIYQFRDFYAKSGEKNFRLLSFISSLFNNSSIIEVGSNDGLNTLALSYNQTNIIHSFDIVNNVKNDIIKEQSNINFQYYDLWDKSNQQLWLNTILNSKFIFLNIDTHNGSKEYEFYNFLKKINYSGFLICDNIWHFKNMRDNFWYKLNNDFCYDLTEYGNWSGTGIVTFNNNYKFNKNDNSNWTLVTAYFDLTKCPDASKEIKERDINYYLNNAISTLHLPYNLVIYCDEESLLKIKALRPSYLFNKTQYVVCNFDDFCFKKNNVKLNDTFKTYRNKIIENRKSHPYYFDKRNTASYYLFCMSRYIMLKEVIDNNIFNSTHFCWINFCMERMGYKNIMYLDEALSVNREKFSTCYIDYVPHELVLNDTKEYFKFGRCSMCSGFFTGNTYYMYNVCDLIENKFLEYLEQGYGHADEQIYSPVYFQNENLFEHYYGNYQEMITNYKYIREDSSSPIVNFIRNSFKYHYHKKSLEACNFVLNSYNLEKCNIEPEKLAWLLWYKENLEKYFLSNIK